MSGGSRPEHEVRYIHDVKVPMRDGVRLSVDLYLPKAPGPFPVILWAVWWAKRGYAVVAGDCRGRFESEGVFYAYVDDGRDTCDRAEWISRQSWYGGRLGTYGRSYGGILPTVAIASACEAAGIHCAIGSNMEWDIATAAMAHLAASQPNILSERYGADLIGSFFHTEHAWKTPMDVGAGHCTVPAGPGLGVELDWERVKGLQS